MGVFCGDFNADGNDDEKGQAGGLAHEKWVRGLCMVTEALQTAPTYWHPSPESPGYTPTGRRLDRWFLNLAPHMLASFACNAAIIPKVPKCSTGDPISDHLPLSLSVSPRQEVPPSRRAIPEWLLREPEFALITATLLESAHVESFPPPLMLPKLKAVLRQAERMTLAT